MRKPHEVWAKAVDNMAKTLAYVWANRLIFYKALRFRFPGDPEDGRKYGWKHPDLVAHLNRHWTGSMDNYPQTVWRLLGERTITGDQRGEGHLGGDFWRVLRDKKGKRKGRVYERHLEGRWWVNDICTSLLAPGPRGPVGTTRLEVLREGVQECEARIFIERALLDEKLKAKLGAKLAKRCQEALDERVRIMLRGLSSLQLTGNCYTYATSVSWCKTPGVAGHAWFVASGWQERSRKLYALAAEVEQALGKRQPLFSVP